MIAQQHRGTGRIDKRGTYELKRIVLIWRCSRDSSKNSCDPRKVASKSALPASKMRPMLSKTEAKMALFSGSSSRRRKVSDTLKSSIEARSRSRSMASMGRLW